MMAMDIPVSPALLRWGQEYANPRMPAFNPNLRADRIFLGLRNIIGLDGMLSSCDRAEECDFDPRSKSLWLFDAGRSGMQCQPNHASRLERTAVPSDFGPVYPPKT